MHRGDREGDEGDGMTMRAIGLARGTVRVVRHNSAWNRLYRAEAKRLRHSLGPLARGIEHIGSTSVPGLMAKPILDIAVGIRRFDELPKVQRLLERLAYSRPRKGDRSNVTFVKGAERSRTHYLHVVRYDGRTWKRDIQFRDWLRTHTRDRERYAALKKRLATRYASDRKRYTAQKDDFIKSILRKTS